MEEKELILSPMIAEQMMQDKEYSRGISKIIARYLNHDYGYVTPERAVINDRILAFHRKESTVGTREVRTQSPFDLVFARYENPMNKSKSLIWVFEEDLPACFYPRIWIIKPEEYNSWFLPMKERKVSA